jgi:hypothetical protein
MTQLLTTNQAKAITYSLIGIIAAGIAAVSAWNYKKSK